MWQWNTVKKLIINTPQHNTDTVHHITIYLYTFDAMMFTKLPHRTTLKKMFTHFKINIEKYIVFVKFNKNSLPQKHYSINNHRFSAIRLQCITLILKNSVSWYKYHTHNIRDHYPQCTCSLTCEIIIYSYYTAGQSKKIQYGSSLSFEF